MSILSLFGRSRSVSRPAPARLGFETLEDRQLLSGNSISGYVFNDVVPNGLFQLGDQGINGNTLLLYRGSSATGTPIAAATSGATGVNGLYQFTTDNSVSQTPTPLSYKASFANKTTNWTQSGQVSRFDPSLGALQSIQIVSSTTLQAEFGLQSFDGEAANINATVNGNLVVTLPGMAPGFSMTTQLSLSNSFNAAAFNPANYPSPSNYFGGPSGHDSGLLSRTSSQTLTITNNPGDPNFALFQSFQGTGTLTFSAHAGATSTVNGPGNVLSNINSTAGGQVQVIYTYIPSNALKPGTYTILQTSTPPGYLPGLKSSNGVVIPNSTNTNAITVTLTNGASTNNNFAEVRPASLSGHVYLALNNTSRTGLSGVRVTLSGSNDLGAIVPIVAMTLADGSYSFGNLRPGTYTIAETPPPGGYIQGTNVLGTLNGAPPGTSPGKVVNSTQFQVTVGPGMAGVNYDFNELLPPATPQVNPPAPTPPPTQLGKILFIGTTIWIRR